MSPRSRHLLSWCLATLCLGAAACQLPDADERGAAAEGLASGLTLGQAKIPGRLYRLRLADGSPVQGLAVLAGGRVHHSRDGSFLLADSARRELEARGRMAFMVVVPGYAPVEVPFGQQAPVILTPVEAPLETRLVPRSGGRFVLPDSPFALTLPPEMLTRGETGLSVSLFAPKPDGGARLQAEREAFLAQAGRGASGCDAPMPCPPIEVAAGMLVTIDGPLKPGTIALRLDLGEAHATWDGQGEPPAGLSDAEAAWSRAAARIQATLEAVARDPGAAALLALLEREHGLVVSDDVLTIEVPVGLAAASDGFVRVDGRAFALLGVQLDLSVVSAVNQSSLPVDALPEGLAALAGAPPESPLKPQAGAGLISDKGLGVISNNGAGLISDRGGSLIGHNGGSLIGKVKAPLEAAKYRLLATFPVLPMPAIKVELVHAAPVSTETDAAGAFVLRDLPPTGEIVFLKADVGGNTYLGMGPAPRLAGESVRVDLDPDTTAVTTQALRWLRDGCVLPSEFSASGYRQAVSDVGAVLDGAALDQVLEAQKEDARPIPASVSDRMGGAFVTKAFTVDSRVEAWRPLIDVAPGARVSFDIALNKVDVGPPPTLVDYRGLPGVGALNIVQGFPYGAVLVRWPGQGPMLYPRGRTITVEQGGLIEFIYADGAGRYGDNSGTIEGLVGVRRCP